MKIKVTEIEAAAEDLRCSSTLSGALSDLLRRAFLPRVSSKPAEDETEEDEEE